MPKPEPVYRLWPKQQEAMRLLGLTPDWQHVREPIEELLYGGEAGGGKSLLQRCVGVTLCTIWPGAVVPIFRRTYPELEETHIRAIQREVPTSVARYNAERHELRFANGSVLEFRHCEREDDVIRYQSADWDALLVDEATHFTKGQIEYLRSRVRSVRVGWRPIAVYTTNPGNVGHLYFKTGFIDAAPPGTTFVAPPEDGGMRRYFLRARLDDNPSLKDEYRRRLEGISDPAIRRALLEGDWSIYPGQFFEQWRAGKHTIPRFPIPAHWTTRYFAVDFGYGAPWSCHFYARDEDLWRQERIHRWFAYREFYSAGVRDEEQARLIGQAIEADRQAAGAGLEFVGVGDPSMWNRKPEQAVSIADVYAREGVYLVPANNDRVPGWQRVHDYLADQSDGYPAVVYFEDCLDAIRTIPAVARDRVRVEDVDTKGEDHAADELRYFVMSVGPIELHRGERPGRVAYGWQGAEKPPAKPGLFGRGVDPRTNVIDPRASGIAWRPPPGGPQSFRALVARQRERLGREAEAEAR